MSEQPAPAIIVERSPSRLNRFWIVIAIVGGVLAGIGWNMIDFSESITVGEVTAQYNLHWANSLLAAFVAGVAGFCIVLAIAPDQYKIQEGGQKLSEDAQQR